MKKVTKRIQKNYTPEYREHLEKIEKAEVNFKKEPNTDTATYLSNLKNNEFRKPEEVFTEDYIKRITKRVRKEKISHGFEKGDINIHLKIGYDGKYGFRATELKGIALIIETEK